MLWVFFVLHFVKIDLYLKLNTTLENLKYDFNQCFINFYLDS